MENLSNSCDVWVWHIRATRRRVDDPLFFRRAGDNFPVDFELVEMQTERRTFVVFVRDITDANATSVCKANSSPRSVTNCARP
jgi:hypothetical protein